MADTVTEQQPDLPDAFKFTIKEQKQRSKDDALFGWGCTKCEHKSFTPMYVCSECGNRNVEVVQLPTEGTVESFTIQKIAIEEFINEVPFAFAVIRLDDGTIVPGWIPDVSRDDEIPAGQRVRHEGTYKPGFMFERA